MEKTTQTLEELATEAAAFVASLSPQEGGATLVTLSGELGAGKTAFAQAVARALGVEDVVTSPTFVLEKIYQLEDTACPPAADGHGVSFKQLVHIDAYRLESGTDLAHLGFDELMKDSNNLILLEWPERVNGALPVVATRVALRLNDDGSRTVSYG